MKVRTRIMMSFLVIGGLAFVYLLTFVDRTIKPVYLEPIEDSLVELSSLVSSQVSLASAAGRLETGPLEELLDHVADRPLRARIYNRFKTAVDLHLYVTDSEGRVVFDSQGKALGQNYSAWNDVSRTLRGEYGARASWEERPGGRVLVLYAASPVMWQNKILGVVSVGKPTPVVYSFFQKVRRQAFLGVSLAAVLGIIWSVLITNWVTKPIRSLTEYAVAVRDGRRGTLPKLGRSDIGVLGRAFEEMRDALEGKKYVEDYVQSLTHELKSPLSAIRGAAELLEEPMAPQRRAAFLANIQNESLRIQNVVDRLLELSAIESRKSLRNPEELDLVGLARDVAAGVSVQLERKKIQLEWCGHGSFPVRGERFLLRLALSNLMQNAIAFTPVGGTISLAWESGQFSVIDDGPGVPPYARDRVFERFYSLQHPESGKKSSGLGLSIVKQVAELHGARAFLENRQGGGAAAGLRFPPGSPETEPPEAAEPETAPPA